MVKVLERGSLVLRFFFFGVWSNFNKLKTPDQ